ncbi:hypothetical protein [Subtercola lobariae]|uniref:Uncharacterized protein n=1 Tax=Subtercola lobariae TaxID=1588641 RepID=A0A917AYU8_9MICO|nr:hypothetical protein [Subtercola lobariae]GGF11333.1 hypothetical protein GCM10011399_01450 [Subtercola lobariae]
MAPRKSAQAHQLAWMVGEALDDTPAEVAHGIFLPHTRAKVTTKFKGYDLEVIVRIEDRQPVCDLLSIKASRGGPSVTATTLREIPVASIIEQTLAGVFGYPFRFDGDERVEVATQSLVNERASREPRRVLMPRVVAAYREALANEATRSKPIVAVAQRLNYQPGYISRLVSEARKEGLLGAASPGMAGEQELPSPSEKDRPTGQ